MAVRRRPSDFGGRGPVMFQTATTCCTCCCLHWIGAGIGGTWGIIAAWRAEKKREPAVHPMAKRYLLHALWISIVAFVVSLALLIGLAQHVSGADAPTRRAMERIAEPLLIALAFAPSVAFLLVGAAVMLAAVLARIRARKMPDPVERKQVAAGMRLAWRIAWTSFVGATFASGAGYLAMYVIALFMD